MNESKIFKIWGNKMDSNDLKKWVVEHFQKSETLHSYINPESGKEFQIFETPLIGIGNAYDSLFQEYKKEGIIGPWFLAPGEWLPEAKSVISIFFPFTETVRVNNRNNSEEPAPVWTFGRIEGQDFINRMACDLCNYLKSLDYNAVVPAVDKRFLKLRGNMTRKEFPTITENTFGSNWSERHAAFVCGLGTFGLSKGLITKKGMAGRFASVITTCSLEADVRPYKDIYEYCSRCGACIHRCPVKAISKNGKDDILCRNQIDKFKEKFYPRFGCGKCQTKVPCEHQIPVR